MQASRKFCAVLLAAGLAVACNPVPGARQVTLTPTGAAVGTATVSSAASPVRLGANAGPGIGAFTLTLPPAALAGPIGRLGPVNVTAQLGGPADLTQAEQQAAATVRGGSLLGALAVDINGAGGLLGGAGFRVSQATDLLSFTVVLPAGIQCQAGQVLVYQLLGGQPVQLQANVSAGGDPLVIDGSALATFGSQRLVFLFVCPVPVPTPTPVPPTPTPSPSPTPTATPTASPSPTPTPSVSASPQPISLLALGDTQTLTVSQGSGQGNFTVSPCLDSGGNTVATVAPSSGPGPFTVTAVAPGLCTITVTGQGGLTAPVQVRVTTTSAIIN